MNRLSLLIIALLGSAQIAWAEQVAAGELDVKPKACGKNDSGECHLDLNVSYKANQPFCLLIGEHKYQCWNSASQGHAKIKFRADTTTRLRLVTAKHEQVLDEAEIKVLDKVIKRRRRQRNPWSLF